MRVAVACCCLLAGVVSLASPRAVDAALTWPAVEVLTRDCLARFGSDLVRECEVVAGVASDPEPNLPNCLKDAAGYQVDPQTAQKLCSYYYQVD